MSLNYYELDSCHYYTHPRLSFDACLKMTNIEMELLCDHRQFLFVENSIRGGVSVVSHRHTTANNEFVSYYNPDDLTSRILFVDANNLYDNAMSLPFQLDFLNFCLEKKSENLTCKKQQLPIILDSFSKSILSIQYIFMSYIMSIPLLLKRRRSHTICSLLNLNH